MSDQKEMDHEDGDMMHQEGEAQPQQSTAPTLSKSWAIKTAHVPTFTGGKITHCHTHGLADEPSEIPFMLLPVGGDVAIIDANKGIKLGTVRGEDSGPVDEEDEEEGIDADAITAYALSWNDQIILTCSHNSVLRQYTLGKTSSPSLISLVKTWGKSGHNLPVTELEFHISSVFCATGSVDGSVRIWDVRGAFVTHVFRPLTGGSGGGSGTLSVTALRWLSDIQQLVVAIGRDDGSIAIHDLRDKEQMNVFVLRDHVSAVTSMDWNKTQDLFVTSGRDSVVNLWKVGSSDDINSGEKSARGKKKKKAPKGLASYKRTYTLPIYEQVEGMVVLPPNAGRRELVVATAGSKGQVRLWEICVSSKTGQPALKLMADEDPNECFGEARGGYMNLLCCPHGKPSGNKSDSVQKQLIVADAEHNISFFSLSGKAQEALTADRTIVGHNDDILDLKLIPNPDGPVSRIVVATNSAQVRLFSLESFSCEVLDRHTATVLCVDVSPCGRYVATCGKDKQMRIWHLASQKCVAVAAGHTEAVGSTGLSRKLGRYDVQGKAATNGGGAFAVSVSIDRTLKRWNLPGAAILDESAARGEEISLKAFHSVRAHEKDINIVSVAPNDSLIATGSQDKTVKLWKAADLSLQATLKGHRRGVWECQFSPFDRILATGSGDRSIKLWSLGDFSCVRTFQGHVASVLRIRFLAGGLQLVSSGADGLVKLWTIRTNECAATMDGHSDKVWALDLSPGDKTLVSGGADSRLVVWEDTTKEVEETKQAEEVEAILLDQKLANHLRHKEYAEALEISLERDKPYQALRVLNAIVETELEKGRNGLDALKRHAGTWSSDRLLRILKYCREWNTRARNSHVALMVVKAVVCTVPANKLAAMEGVPEILAGIVPYTERHFDRLDRLYASSYLLDFVLHTMGSLEATDSKEDFLAWEPASKLVLPPKHFDGKVQVGGKAVVQHTGDEVDGDEVLTVGDSGSSDDEIDYGALHKKEIPETEDDDETSSAFDESEQSGSDSD